MNIPPLHPKIDKYLATLEASAKKEQWNDAVETKGEKLVSLIIKKGIGFQRATGISALGGNQYPIGENLRLSAIWGAVTTIRNRIEPPDQVRSPTSPRNLKAKFLNQILRIVAVAEAAVVIHAENPSAATLQWALNVLETRLFKPRFVRKSQKNTQRRELIRSTEGLRASLQIHRRENKFPNLHKQIDFFCGLIETILVVPEEIYRQPCYQGPAHFFRATYADLAEPRIVNASIAFNRVLFAQVGGQRDNYFFIVPVYNDKKKCLSETEFSVRCNWCESFKIEVGPEESWVKEDGTIYEDLDELFAELRRKHQAFPLAAPYPDEGQNLLPVVDEERLLLGRSVCDALAEPSGRAKKFSPMELPGFWWDVKVRLLELTSGEQQGIRKLYEQLHLHKLGTPATDNQKRYCIKSGFWTNQLFLSFVVDGVYKSLPITFSATGHCRLDKKKYHLEGTWTELLQKLFPGKELVPASVPTTHEVDEFYNDTQRTNARAAVPEAPLSFGLLPDWFKGNGKKVSKKQDPDDRL